MTDIWDHYFLTLLYSTIFTAILFALTLGIKYYWFGFALMACLVTLVYIISIIWRIV